MSAQSDRFVSPEFRGQPGALYAGWDDFTSASITIPNLPDRPGSAPNGFTFTQLAPGGFVTSSGNLYSFSTPLSHRIDVSATTVAPAMVVLQTRTLGAALADSTVQLETFDGTAWTAVAAPENELLFAETISTGFGAALDETRRWTWPLGPGAVSALRLTFQASGTSQSFQAAALDLAPPAPLDDLYAAWLAVHFSPAEYTDSSVSGPDADPDGDGLSNLLEYALGGEPRDATSAPAPTVQLTGSGSAPSTLALAFSRRADPALVYTVEASSDLVTWEPTPVFRSTGTANLTGPVLAPDRIAVGGEHPRRFLRLVVGRL